MDFKELEYILVIAQERSISRAAERLYVSQPALSRFLLKMEDRLGTELFVRRNRQYFPTQAGELYLNMARKILGTKQEFDHQLKQLLESDRGSLSFGITPGRARTVLPLVIPAFHQMYPNFELNIFEEDVDTLEQYLKNGKIEAAFFTMSPRTEREDKWMHYELIFREEVVLCVAKEAGYSMMAENRPGRKYPWLDLHHVEHETFLLLKNNMRLGQYAAQLLEEYQLCPRIMRLSSIDTALALAAQHYGAAFSSSYRIEEHQQAKLLDIFSIGDCVPEWDFVAVYQKDYEVKKPLKYLERLMKE